MKMRVIFYTIVLMMFSGCLEMNPRVDLDHDGVVDIYDRCKNTPFLVMVDSTGCAQKRQGEIKH